jgi:hypothetical protein
MNMEIINTVWINEAAKWKHCVEQMRQNNLTVIITWFEDTWHVLENIFAQAQVSTSTLFPCRQVRAEHIKDAQVIFAEHYPLYQKEKELYKKLHITQAEVYSSLDEPIFRHFGSERLYALLQKMNCNENEPIHHKMVDKAIKRAQDKIASVVAFELGATTQADWLMKNLTA